MTRFAVLLRPALLVLAALVLSGCVPQAQSQSDEEKEAHFLEGKSRVSTMDYKGAIESFEKALEANPHSAAAHFELGCLFDQKEVEPASAIYHYEHYLQLRPTADNAELVRQHIMTCKQELAKTVSLGPVTEKVQHDLELLTEENQRLTEANKALREQLDNCRTLAHLPPSTNVPGLTSARSTPVSGVNQSNALRVESDHAGAATRPVARADLSPASSGRTHTVKPGETPTLIARKYGIRVEALMAANPKVEPRRLRVGQALSIPGP